MLNTFLKGIVVLVLASLAYVVYVGMTNKSTEMITTVDVEAPPEFVFKYIDHPELTVEWIPGIKSFELVSGEPLEIGSKYLLVFEENGKDIPMTEIVTAYEPGKRFAFDLNNEFVNGKIDISVESNGIGATVTELNTFSGNNFIAKAMTGLFKQGQKKRQQETYNMLKEVVEEAYALQPNIEQIDTLSID